MLGKQGGDGHKSGGGPFYQNDLTIQGKEGKQQRGMNDAGHFQILIAQGHGQQGRARVEPRLQALGVAAQTCQRNDQRQHNAQQQTLEQEGPEQPCAQNAVQPAVQKAQHDAQ